MHLTDERFRTIRQHTVALCQPLEADDFGLQSMPDCSPPKWHLAHTTWFYETFVLARHQPGFQPFHPDFNFLFNSYYEAAGSRHPRPQRGLIARPTVAEVFAYRQHVDAAVLRVLADGPAECAVIVELGLQHEQQHQELLLTDLKNAWALNAIAPAYMNRPPTICEPSSHDWLAFPAELREIGHAGGDFAFDNEGPRHRVYVDAFEIGDRLVTNGEYQMFMRDGGYRSAEWWLADGWAVNRARGWDSPLYWRLDGDRWRHFTLFGWQDVDANEPVTHLSFFEADAYARWAGCRLPTEAEWEVSAPLPGFRQRDGVAWQWTASPYVAYPGYRPASGGALFGLAEYNAKFFNGCYVLRGGSCVTPAGHTRLTYRNFFAPEARWQFTGIRLAR